MNHNDALLQAVIEAPDDDAPRLVYADWLEENGDAARAEFIRVQCSLEEMPDDDPRRVDLQQREKELLEQYGWIWAEPLETQIRQWVYRRGFIERVEMGLGSSCEAISAVLQKAPIRHIRDISQLEHLNGLVEALPYLKRLTGLEFWGLYVFDNALLQKILDSPHLSNLRTLILHHDRNGELADEKVLVHALQSPYRANLEELAVNVDTMWRGPSRTILQAIATSPYLRKLRKLILTNAGDEGNRPEMDVKTARALGKSPNLAGLEELDLGMTSFPIEVWDEVLKWPCLPQLRWLRLYSARQINPPNQRTVAKIQDLPAYRSAFEEKVAAIDWGKGYISPSFRETTWKGLAWTDLRGEAKKEFRQRQKAFLREQGKKKR